MEVRHIFGLDVGFSENEHQVTEKEKAAWGRTKRSGVGKKATGVDTANGLPVKRTMSKKIGGRRWSKELPKLTGRKVPDTVIQPSDSIN